MIEDAYRVGRLPIALCATSGALGPDARPLIPSSGAMSHTRHRAGASSSGRP
jgi:hypothetical protein